MLDPRVERIGSNQAEDVYFYPDLLQGIQETWNINHVNPLFFYMT